MRRGASRGPWLSTGLLLACGGGGSAPADDAAPTPDGGAVDVSVVESGSDADGGCTSCGADAGADAKDGGPAIVPAFYVATNGSDGNPGTFAAPFATLGKAQTAMRASSSIKTTYVRAGTYKPAAVAGNCDFGATQGSSVALSAADTGETWSYYPPDGIGTAILDGQSTLYFLNSIHYPYCTLEVILAATLAQYTWQRGQHTRVYENTPTKFLSELALRR